MSSHSTPDLSGFWRVNLSKSTFVRGEAPKEIIVRIEHREPALVQSMIVVGADGREQRQTFTYTTSGEPSHIDVSGHAGETRAHWNGAELVINSTLHTPNRTFHFSDHWSLSADGRTLTMAHRDDDLAGQVAVLERAPADVAARFDPV